MAKKEGLTFVETLTGFKWMANEASDLESLTGKDIFRSRLCIVRGTYQQFQFCERNKSKIKTRQMIGSPHNFTNFFPDFL